MQTEELWTNLSVAHFSEAVFETGRLGVDRIPAYGLGLNPQRWHLSSLSRQMVRTGPREPRGPGHGFGGAVAHLQHLVDLHTGLWRMLDSHLHHRGRWRTERPDQTQKSRAVDFQNKLSNYMYALTISNSVSTYIVSSVIFFPENNENSHHRVIFWC